MFRRLERLTFSTLSSSRYERAVLYSRNLYQLGYCMEMDCFMFQVKTVRLAFGFCSDSFRIVQESLSVCRSDSSASG